MAPTEGNPTRDSPLIRACIFDVDGLLINSEDIYTEIYNNILREHHCPDMPWSVKARQQSRGREVSLCNTSLSLAPIPRGFPP